MTVTAEYAAGFFDGEGCVYVRRISSPSNYKGRTYYRVVASVGNCHKGSLLALKNTFGGTVYETNKKKVKEKDWSRQYRWVLSCTSATDFLYNIEPHSIIKKPYILLALQFAALVGEKGEPRNEEGQAAIYKKYQEMRSKETRTRHFPKK
jgi:hypothetical protein